MSKFDSIGEILACMGPLLSEDELGHFARLSTAINHALTVAREMPSTFDSHARGLIVDKLQEAQHWSLEVLTIQTRNPTQ